MIIKNINQFIDDIKNNLPFLEVVEIPEEKREYEHENRKVFAKSHVLRFKDTGFKNKLRELLGLDNVLWIYHELRYNTYNFYWESSIFKLEERAFELIKFLEKNVKFNKGL